MPPNGEVKLVDGKLVKTGKAAKVVGPRERRYIYPWEQFGAILKIAKADGLDVGDTQATATNVVRTVTGLVLDAFIADRARAQK